MLLTYNIIHTAYEIITKMAIITSHWLLDTVIVLILTVGAAYLFMTRKFNYWKKRGVFQIKPLPFVGNFGSCLTQRQSPAFFFRDMYNKAKGKPYIGIYILDKPCLLLCDREIIKDILIRDFNNFCNRSCTSSPDDRLGCSTLLLMKNPTWKIVRNKLTPIFTSAKLKRMLDLLLECTVNLETYLDSLQLDGNGKEIDIKDLYGNLTTDAIGSIAFGLNIDSVNNPECEFRQKGRLIFDTSNIIRSIQLFIGFYYPELCSIAGVTAFGKETSDFLRNAFWDTIKRRIKSGENRGDLIDILIEFTKEFADEDLGDFKFDGDDLVAQAAIFFVGGFETTSSTIAFTLHELALHPEYQDKLRKEILDALDETDGKITFNMVLNLPYLDMVLSEAMRKYPVLALLDRETIKPYTISKTNLSIEKGLPIFISLYGLHYDPEYFPDPEKYDPERFNEENKHNIPSFTYMPFGEGPRKCIGSRLGLLQAKLIILKTLCQYEVTPSEKTMIPMVLDPKVPVTMAMGGKIYLNIRKLNVKQYPTQR